MKLKTIIESIVKEYLKEEVFNGLVLYRGVEYESFEPTDKEYNFFSKDKRFAEDYGDYIWECKFKPMNLFISYKESSIKELYNNGFKLRDTYVEDNWNKEDLSNLYDYGKNINFDDWGYKSADAVISSPYFDSDTWEMIENTDGVLDYILSKYDGVVLLEGGELTYYVDTDKIIDFKLV